ncbi:hypothetical protein DFP72DRAFT_1110736 [Ephemerocybe angulata]|uniref:GH16 domain-containing protein n=1 Tax=Ephemerocybe angulata TaxID=980116 RepID=A0A8H6M9G6_9AGAR|nr:hypothetical protein DFP72DRAFT_1110736 [Tulosesus angulatus]
MRFFTGDDPTDGLVHYVTRERAFSQNYTYFEDDGTVIMESDMKTKLNPGEKRERYTFFSSVRIETMKEYNGGLFILDLKRAPWGCAVWPAYWTTSRFDWPYVGRPSYLLDPELSFDDQNGEIDILEGTHDNEHNQITWHTCNDDKKIGRYGCSAMEWSQASYGLHLNLKAEGHSFRAAIPEDVTAGEPRPSTWGPPSAVLSNTRCNITQYFKKHVVVFDITFCGNYAGNNYNASQCPGTCAERLADPANLIVRAPRSVPSLSGLG